MDLKKIAQMIVLRISHKQIAMALGVTEGRISQLISDNHELIKLIAEYAGKQATEDIGKEAHLESIERKLIQHIDQLATQSDSLSEATNALGKIAKLRTDRAALRLMDGGADDGATKLQLNLSNVGQAQINIMFSSAKEIIEINGRNMATMPANKLKTIIKEKSNVIEASPKAAYEQLP